MLEKLVSALKGPVESVFMSVNSGDGEPLELCEECGSPLLGSACTNCGTSYRDGASPVGAAPLDRRDLSKVLGRSVGARAHGSYALSMQQEEGMAPLRKEIDILVEQFSASPESKASVKQSAERLAVKVMGEVGPTKAAIASVAQEFLRQGRSMAEVSSCVAKVHAGLDRVKDMIVQVGPLRDVGEVVILVDGRERPFSSAKAGLYCKLRIPVFASDDGKLMEFRGTEVTKHGYDPKRMVRGAYWSEFVIRVQEINFELFKVLKEARLSGLPVGAEDLGASFRKFSISKLPVTELLLKESGLFNEVSAEYAKLYAAKVMDGQGRSPRKLAEDALREACEEVVPGSLSDLMILKFRLKPSGMKSLIVKWEPAEYWPG